MLLLFGEEPQMSFPVYSEPIYSLVGAYAVDVTPTPTPPPSSRSIGMGAGGGGGGVCGISGTSSPGIPARLLLKKTTMEDTLEVDDVIIDVLNCFIKTQQK